MNKIEIIGYSSSLIDFIANEVVKSDNFYNTLVVFPNIRPGYYLKKRIMEIKKSDTILLDVLPVDEFVKNSLLEIELFRKIDRMDMLSILYNNFQEEIKSLLEIDDLNFDDFLGWGNIIINDFEELKINGVEHNEIKVYDFIIKDGVIEKDDDTIKKELKSYHEFSMLYDNFYNFLIERKLYSRSLIYYRFSKLLKESKKEFHYSKMIFAGFFAFNKIEKEIFNYLYSLNESFFVFIAHSLLKDKISFLDRNIAIKAEPVFNRINLIKVLNRHQEIFSLKNNLKNSSISKDEVLDFESDTAIVMPDSSIIPLLIENVLTDVKKFNISAGFSIKFSPFYSFIELVKKNFEKLIREDKIFYFIPAYLELISHQYIKTIGDFKKIADEIKKRYEDVYGGYIELEELENNFKEVVEFNSKIIKPFEDIKDIGDFIDKIMDMIGYLKNRSYLSSHPYWNNLLESIEGYLKDFKKKEISSLKFNKTISYFTFLDLIFNEINLPFTGSPIEGLQCIGFLESRGLKFKDLYIIDVNEDVIPPAGNYKSFISDYIRKKLEITDSRVSNDIYRYYFETIVYMALNVWIFYIDNNRLMRSPLVERLVWEAEKRGIKINEVFEDMPGISFKTLVGKKVMKTEKIKRFLKDLTFSATSIEKYIECELAFYYNYVLGFYEEDNMEGEIDARVYGKLYHYAIKMLFDKHKDKRFKEMDFSREFLKDLSKEVSARYISNKCIDYYFIWKQLYKRLLDLIEFFKSFKSDYRLVDCEVEKKIYLSIRDEKVKIKAIADMIVEREDVLIIDFKTAKDGTKYLPDFKEINQNYREIKRVQLPLYIMVFGREYKKVSNASIITLGSKNIEEILCYDEKGYSKKNQMEFEEAINKIIEEIIYKDYFEETDDKDICEGCIFKKMCYSFKKYEV